MTKPTVISMQQHIVVSGGTWPIKDYLESMGGAWVPRRKCWIFDEGDCDMVKLGIFIDQHNLRYDGISKENVRPADLGPVEDGRATIFGMAAYRKRVFLITRLDEDDRPVILARCDGASQFVPNPRRGPVVVLQLFDEPCMISQVSFAGSMEKEES